MLSKKMEQSTSISSCSRNPARAPDETGMEQVLSDLQALTGLYGLLHRANENLDEASRALLMRMLDNATQQALLKQAKMLLGPLMSPALERKLSIQPGHRTGGETAQRLKLIASPSLSSSEMSRWINFGGSARSRDSCHVYDDHPRRERDDRLLARVASNRSSRTAMPRLHPSTPEQRFARLGSYRSSRVAEPRRGETSGSAWEAGRAGSSSTHCRIGRLDSELSMGGVTSRCGSWRTARRGEATPRRSSSSSDGEAVTIRSCIRPNQELLDRCVRRAEEKEEMSLRLRGKKDGTVRSGVSMGWSSHRPRRPLDRIDSGSTYSNDSNSSSSAYILSPSTIPMAPLTPSASASSRSSSSVLVSPRGSARPEYAFEEASNMSRSRRRRERQERREGLLRRFKNKLALVFHHRHDHHHHHHIGAGRRSGSPVSRHDRRGKNNKSPWSYLGGMFHHRTAGHNGGKKKKKRTSKTVVTAKRVRVPLVGTAQSHTAAAAHQPNWRGPPLPPPSHHTLPLPATRSPPPRPTSIRRTPPSAKPRPGDSKALQRAPRPSAMPPACSRHSTPSQVPNPKASHTRATPPPLRITPRAAAVNDRAR